MQKFWKLVLLFWRPLFVWNIVISLASLSGILTYGLGFLGAGVIIKLIGYTAATYLQQQFSNQKNYYYLNAGYSIRKMYGCTFLIDFCLYLLAVYSYIKFQ